MPGSVDTLSCEEKAERGRETEGERVLTGRNAQWGVRACIPANKQSDVGEAHGGVEEAAMGDVRVQGVGLWGVFDVSQKEDLTRRCGVQTPHVHWAPKPRLQMQMCCKY